MALGRDYDWYGAIRAYEDALAQYYRNVRPDKPDFLDYLLDAGSMGAMFIPGLGPAAKFGIGSGLDLLGSMKRGEPYRPDWQGLLQLTMAPKIAQQERIGDVLGAGEGVLQPEDINIFGQAQPEWVDWANLARQVSPETPSPFPTGPMSISKEAQEKLGPLFVRSPENQMMRQLQMQRAMNLAYPTPTKKTPLLWQLRGTPPGQMTPQQMGAMKAEGRTWNEKLRSWIKPETPKAAEKPPAKVQESQRKVEWERLNKTIEDAKAKGLKYTPLPPKQYEQWRVLNAEFGKKEAKPPEWTTTLEGAYGRRDPRLEGHMTPKQWKELSRIGKPISELPSQATLLQRNQIVSDLGEKTDSSEKSASIQEMKASLENEREALEAMGINVDYLLKYLNTFQF